MTTSDVKDCLETHSKLCRFRTPIAKSDTRRSCALSLFKNDVATQGTICKTETGDWPGSQVTYLGDRRWGITDTIEQDLLIACPNRRSSQTKRLPKIGIFEIPVGCEARTSEWIFPTNRQVEKYVQPDLDKIVLPPLHIFQEGDLSPTATK